MALQIWVGSTYDATWELAHGLAQALALQGTEVELHRLQEAPLDAALTAGATVLMLTSSHGQGELPESAMPFLHQLQAAPRYLGALRYGLIGVGDSSYAHFCGGALQLDAALLDLGAQRLGDAFCFDEQSADDKMWAVTEWTLAWVEAHVGAAA